MKRAKPPPRLRPVLEEVCRLAGWLWARGWAEANAGNVSVDVSGLVSGSTLRHSVPTMACTIPDPVLADRSLLVSAAGSRFRDIAGEPEQGLLVVRVNSAADGYRIVWDASDGRNRPTSELPAHLLVHGHLLTAGSESSVVLHSHPTHLVALSHSPEAATSLLLSKALWDMLPEVKALLPEGIGVAPYCLPGSLALAQATREALVDHRMVVWRHHGVMVTAGSAAEAFDLLDVAEKAARVRLLCLAAGIAPGRRTEAELAQLASLVGGADAKRP